MLIFLFMLGACIFSQSVQSDEIISSDRMYFILGNQNTPAKGEFAFKYKLLSKYNTYFSYHQKNIWDINHKSSPVIDTNYNPSLIYSFGNHFGFDWNWGILEHISNGKTDLESRGVNLTFLNLFTQAHLRNMTIDFGIKLMHIFNLDDGSSDLDQYIGIWNGLIRLNNFIQAINRKHFLELRGGFGGKYGQTISKGHFEVGLGFRVLPEESVSIYLQHFNGYNQYLLNYKVYNHESRIGIALELP